MSRVVVAGRWDGGIPALPTGDALAAIGRGVLTGTPSSTVVTLPVGTGPTFDEAVAAFLEARDEAAARVARREGRASRCDAPEPPGSMMSFQSDRPLLVATYSPFQRIVMFLA